VCSPPARRLRPSVRSVGASACGRGAPPSRWRSRCTCTSWA